jgi:chemotaxis protein histidine kinase CheA
MREEDSNMNKESGRSDLTDFEIALAELRLVFCDNARESLVRFSKLIKDVERGKCVEDSIGEMIRIWHRFKGSGGTVGFKNISFIAGRMEAALKKYSANGSGDLPGIIKLQKKAIEIFSRIIENDADKNLSAEKQEDQQREFSEYVEKLGFHIEPDQ